MSEEAKFELGPGIESKLAASAIRDTEFARRTEGLINPDYFESIAQATLVALAQEYFETYSKSPTPVDLVKIVKDAVKAKRLRPDMAQQCGLELRTLVKEDISDRDYMVDAVAKFARTKAVGEALSKCIDLRAKGEFEKISEIMQEALLIGAADGQEGIDYLENVETRTKRREEIASGVKPPTGITTGIAPLDNLLYHKGWGIEELTVIMGAAKRGKSMALADFAIAASMAGHNVLVITLEVSAQIYTDRFDSNISEYRMDELVAQSANIETKIKASMANAGCLKIHEYPPDTCTPSMVRRLIDKYRARGIMFDMLVVDYLDIMAPDYRAHDPIQDSKSVWLGMRKLAKEEHIATLSATQTNRDGARSKVSKDTDVAEDFNKIRIADLVLSINRDEEEEKNGEARLYFAASRNQAGGITIKIKQDMERMKFIKQVINIS